MIDWIWFYWLVNFIGIFKVFFILMKLFKFKVVVIVWEIKYFVKMFGCNVSFLWNCLLNFNIVVGDLFNFILRVFILL